MRSTSLRRKVLVLLLLTVVLPASWAGAASGHTPSARPAAAQSLFSRIVALLSSVWAKEGCHIDPSGRCGAPSPANQVEEGCNIDPSGRCRS